MPDASPQSHSPESTHATAALLDTTARWLSNGDDDVALGCECADPALQIERWGQEVLALPPAQR